jgi:hypothetical protein
MAPSFSTIILVVSSIQPPVLLIGCTTFTPSYGDLCDLIELPKELAGTSSIINQNDWSDLVDTSVPVVLAFRTSRPATGDLRERSQLSQP